NLTGNTATGDGGGAIHNRGPLTVINSTFSDNNATIGGGGAIQNAGTLTVTNGTFSGNNKAPLGGAIRDGGTLTVANSTFSGNRGSSGDGSSTSGGAIFSDGVALGVTNSTFTGNSATSGGAINSQDRTGAVTNSTFTGNSATEAGGAIFQLIPTLTVTNSILANSPSVGNCGGVAITDGGHNIDTGDTCGFMGTGCSNTSGMTMSMCNVTNPGLDPAGLAPNCVLVDSSPICGPTQTIALEAGSPAINAGDGAICAALVNNLDQRGFLRPGVGATNCSIGAYEFNAA